MSKLSRFKKAPVLKFPSSKPKVQQRGRFDDLDDDDDDDFKVPISTSSNRHTGKDKEKEKPRKNLPNEKRNSQVEEEYADLGETSTSSYFSRSSRKTEEKVKESGKCSNEVISEPNLKNYQKPKEAGKEVTNIISTATTKSKSKTETDRNHKEDLQEDKKFAINIADKRREATPQDEDKRCTEKAGSNENQKDGKVVCPFCWKKLGDKLSGTTHVKSCAKNLPTERVFEAIQLQEKQIQEWEKLGLTFPGFSTAAAKQSKSSAASATTKGKGDRRRKKANDVGPDPQLELAMALSESLHEEMNSRRIKENQFLIENGLEKEIGLTETLQETRPSSSVAGPRPGNAVSGAAAVRMKTTTDDSAVTTTTVSRRRGKKVELQKLPLYTTDINQKRAIIGERVARILEDSEKKSHEPFYIRDEIPSSKLNVPKSLKSAMNEDATLWKLAQCSEDASEESFSTLQLKQVTEVFETSKYSPSKTDDIRIISPENSKKMNPPVPVAPAKLSSNKAAVCTNQSPIKKSKNQISPSLDGEKKVNQPSSGKVLQSSSKSDKDKLSLKNLPPVVQAITKMLVSGKGTDITCYGREEKPINCHRFMLQARCPRLLDEVVVQSADGKSGRSKRDILPLTDYGHSAVKALIWFIYTGSFQYSDQALVDEVESLGGAYGIIVTDEAGTSTNATTKVERMSTTAEVEVQTEVLMTKDSETMTNDLLNCDVACRNNTEKSFVDFDETSPELFTTLDFEAENHRKNVSPLTTSHRKSIQEENFEEDENILDKAIDPKELEYGNSSVDIFENSDEELNEDPQPVERRTNQSVRACSSSQTFQSDTPRLERDECRAIDEEDDYLRELATPPETQNSLNASILVSEKKRSRSPSRSPSPLFNDEVSYTATQIADLLHSKRNGSETDEFKKANKKQKLDYSIYKNNDFDFNTEMEVELMDVGVSETVDKCGNGIDKHSNSKSCLRESENKGVINFQTPISVQARNRNSLRRSASSPSLCSSSHKLNRSPFLPQVNEVEEYDPFADDCDDSIFAKIPDEVFSKRSPIRPVAEDPDPHTLDTNANASNFYCRSDVPSSETTDFRQNQKPLSPLQESYEDEFTDSRKATGGKKGKPKAKAKPSGPKLKLPSKRTNKKDKDADSGAGPAPATSLSQPAKTKTSKPSSKPSGSSSKSPMLNYSLIDTPVLKQELKKFGIKPLPRSKAKVLLRHIYKETHQ